MHCWEINIKTGLQGSGCVGVDWNKLPQVTDQWRDLMNTVKNLAYP
jgi:hypothetical protein